jgi:RHS repeat-associated protein
MWQSPMDVARTTPPPVADLNMDGVVNSTDSALWSDLLYSTSNASVYADTDLDWDGQDDWNSGGADSDLFYESYSANTGLSGVGRVSSPGVASRTGYAGYQWDRTLGAYHVRYRVYLPDIGRWTRRDPLGYVDGMGLYEYCAGIPHAETDSLGLCAGDEELPNWIGKKCGHITKQDITAEVAAAYDRAVKACKESKRSAKMKVHVECHKSRTDTEDDGTIRISPTLPGAPSSDSVTHRLRHELEHVYQVCKYERTIGQWTCEERIARELQAYRNAGQCGVATAPLAGCCMRACDSVVADAPRCFGKDEGDATRRKPGQKPTGKLACLQRCMQIAPSVTDGDYVAP